MARSTARHRSAGGPFDRFAGGFERISLHPGRGALILAGVMAGLTALHAWAPTLAGWLAIGPATLPELRLTALATNGLLARPAGFLGVLILLAMGGLLFADRLRGAWYHDRVRLVVGALAVLGALVVFDRFVVPGRGYGLAVGALWMVWVGTAVERRWGRRRLLTFAAVIMGVVNLLGALLAWVWPSGQMALTGGGALPLFGEGPVTHALMAVWCFMAGRQRMALLNIEARKLVWVLVAFDAIDLLFGGAFAGLMGLAAIGLTWLLVTGNHRPNIVIDKIRLRLIERRVARRRAGMRVVGGRNDLHRGRPADVRARWPRSPRGGET